jgi:hypothetical protein
MGIAVGKHHDIAGLECQSAAVWQRRAGHAVDHEVVDHEMRRTWRQG